ncbi:MAG: hypothetical protein KDA83_22475, partial [Planctomycetales bacterium]|nr:hypothetical protein [Planctomycetales bacterium]
IDRLDLLEDFLSVLNHFPAPLPPPRQHGLSSPVHVPPTSITRDGSRILPRVYSFVAITGKNGGVS